MDIYPFHSNTFYTNMENEILCLPNDYDDILNNYINSSKYPIDLQNDILNISEKDLNEKCNGLLSCINRSVKKLLLMLLVSKKNEYYMEKNMENEITERIKNESMLLKDDGMFYLNSLNIPINNKTEKIENNISSSMRSKIFKKKISSVKSYYFDKDSERSRHVTNIIIDENQFYLFSTLRSKLKHYIKVYPFYERSSEISNYLKRIDLNKNVLMKYINCYEV